MANDLLAFVVRSSLVMALGLVAMLLLRRRSAALRHRVLLLAFAAAVVVGPLAAIAPTWRLPVALPALSDPPAAAGGVTSVSSSVAGVSPIAASATAPEARGPSLSLAEALLGLWLAGACAAAIRLLAGCFFISRLCASAAAPTDKGWKRMLAQVSERYGLGRAVRVGVTDRQDVLATFGAVSPTVLLPAASRAWSSERLRVVLLHELAHIKRADCRHSSSRRPFAPCTGSTRCSGLRARACATRENAHATTRCWRWVLVQPPTPST